MEETNISDTTDESVGTTEDNDSSFSQETSTQAEESEGTQAQQVEAEQSSEDKESFFDPKTVPEELMPAYKQMQGAFTKKTQEIAEVRKNAEEWKQKAEAYSKYEQYVPIIEEMLSPNNAGKSQINPELAALEQQLKQEGYSDEAIQLMKMGADFTLRQFNRERETEKAQQALIAQQRELNAQIEKAETLDPRLSDDALVYQLDTGESVKFGEIVGRMVTADPNWTKSPIEATQRAIKLVDALIGRAKTDGKKELSSLAKNKAQKFPSINSSPQGAGNASGTYSSMRDAGLEAMNELS